jgi:acyl-CoA synthetase (AMP-forming)/AMP-acid ligase II
MKWSVGKIASKRAALTPEKTAIFFEDTPITYRALNQEINRAAHYFIGKVAYPQTGSACRALVPIFSFEWPSVWAAPWTDKTG